MVVSSAARAGRPSSSARAVTWAAVMASPSARATTGSPVPATRAAVRRADSMRDDPARHLPGAQGRLHALDQHERDVHRTGERAAAGRRRTQRTGFRWHFSQSAIGKATFWWQTPHDWPFVICSIEYFTAPLFVLGKISG